MPSYLYVAFGSGGGGGGLHFRNPADTFTGADLAACRTARDAYFVAVATASALLEYQGNEFLSIVLNPADSTDNVFETYLPGNAGKAYAKTQWVERTDAIQGNIGAKGDTGDAIDATARSLAGTATLAAAKANTDLTAEVTARTNADTALGARITALPAGGSPGGGVVAGVPFSPTLIFTADDVDLPDNQTTVAITLTTAWDSFDAFYFSASLRDADAINNLILKEDFQRVGVKAAAGTNWYTGTKPQAIFVLDQNLASGGVSGMAICRIADTTMLLLARSFSSSSVNAQDIRIWGINYGGPGAKGDKGAPGSGTADSTARDSIATEVTQRKQADTDEAIVRDEADVALGGRIDTEIDAREEADTALGGRVDGTNTEVADVKATAEAALTEAETDARVNLATFSKLTDTPAAIVADKFVKSNAGGDALEYVDAPSIAGLSAEVTARKAGDATEVTARTEADAALGIRIDALAVGGSGGGLTETILFDGDVAGSSANILRSLYQGASPAVVDEIIVPETGDLLFTVYPKTTNAFAGHFQIAAEDFITRTGVDGTVSGQGQNTGFAFPVGQNRAFTVTHREVGGVKRFLWSTSHDANLTWHLEIVHLTPAPPSGLPDGSVGEDQLAPDVVTKLGKIPEYTPGPTPHTFIGANRTAAIAALDKYLNGVSVVTQASTRIYSDADNYITISVNASEGIGPKGNKWIMKWGGDSDSAGEIELDTADSLFQAVLKWDVDATTLAGLHAEFSGDSKFSSVVTGNDALIASVIETFGEDVVGNTIFFGGGTRVHQDTAHDWFTHYVDNPAATVTLEYQSRQDIQVWDATLIDFRTVLVLLDSPTKPDPWTVLTHDDSDPEEWQWTGVAASAEAELIERSAGSVTNPTRGSARPIVPATAKEIWVRLSKGSNDINTIKLDRLVLPTGVSADLRAEFRLGVSGIHLRIATNGHVYVKRTTSVSGSITIGCDIWYR